jgi:5-hydroxyisourate hydrolase
MTHISTHVLDTAKGVPAAGIAVHLEQLGANGEWKSVGSGTTDVNGRIANLVRANETLATGQYRLRFATGDYLGKSAFYPEVTVQMRLNAGEKYHLPLLLSPFGYSTYRGS